VASTEEPMNINDLVSVHFFVHSLTNDDAESLAYKSRNTQLYILNKLLQVVVFI